MANNESGFWGQVTIAGLGGILTTIILWMWGLLPTAASWIGHGLSGVWKTATHPVSVPFAIVALALVFPSYQLVRWCATILRKLSMTRGGDTTALSENEMFVLRFLAALDGEWVGVAKIAHGLRISAYLAEQAVEGLLAKSLAIDSTKMMEGPVFRLSSSGRDYAIAQGYTKQNR